MSSFQARMAASRRGDSSTDAPVATEQRKPPRRATQPEIAIIVPTHPPKYAYVFALLRSCALFSCLSHVDMYLVFSSYQDLTDLYSVVPKRARDVKFRPLICGEQCNGNHAEPIAKKFFGLLTLLEQPNAYTYAICFDSETLVTQSLEGLAAAVAAADARRRYYGTSSRDPLPHTLAPAIPILEGGRNRSWAWRLEELTKGFRLHGWWADVPYYRFSLLRRFFAIYGSVKASVAAAAAATSEDELAARPSPPPQAASAASSHQELVARVLNTARVLGQQGFEHTAYKYFTLLAEEGWEFVDLQAPPHSLPSLINASSGSMDDDENGAWIEIVEMLVSDMEALTRLLEATRPLWVTACIPIDRLPAAQRARIFFQFHTDRCLICGARGEGGELVESWLGPPRACRVSDEHVRRYPLLMDPRWATMIWW